MNFKRIITKVHRTVACILAALLCVTVSSSCNQTEKVQSEETTTTQTSKEVTTTFSETTQTTVESKFEPVSEDMPEIVFIMSHHYDNTNILGFYITNTGEVKMYDFRNIAPDEIYDIPDVYDRLEEATCSEIKFAEYGGDFHVMTEENLKSISKTQMVECYKKLLLINSPPQKVYLDCTLPENNGDYIYYGVRNNKMNEKEFVLLTGSGKDYYYEITNSNTEELCSIIFSVFPEELEFYNY